MPEATHDLLISIVIELPNALMREHNRPDRPDSLEAAVRRPECLNGTKAVRCTLWLILFIHKIEATRRCCGVGSVLREVEANLSRHEREKSSLEKDLTQVDSGEIFHLYAEILETLEIEELLYLQLMEVFEDLMK